MHRKIKERSSEKYTYDKEGRLTSITYSDNSMEKFEYDVHGNKTSYTDKKAILRRIFMTKTTEW